MASNFPGGTDALAPVTAPATTATNVAPSLSTRLNTANDAIVAVQNWLNAGLYEPVGVIKLFAGATAPAGYLLCNGQTVSRTTFAALFAICGTTYGAGDGATTFAVPDLSDRVPIGVGTNARGAGIGSATTALAINHLPAHNHSINDPQHVHGINDPGHTHGLTDPWHNHGHSDPGHAHGYSDPGHRHTATVVGTGAVGVAAGGNFNVLNTATSINTSTVATGITISGAVTNLSNTANGTGITVNGVVTGIGAQFALTGISTNNTGSGTPFSIQPPSIALQFIIKT